MQYCQSYQYLCTMVGAVQNTLRADRGSTDINKNWGNSLVIQWLGLHAFTAEGLGSISGRGAKITQAAQCGLKNKKCSPDLACK